MTIHQAKDDDDEFLSHGLREVRHSYRGGKPVFIIMDEIFAEEQRMRELDNIFIHGTFSAPPVGYLNATPTPTGPVTTMPTYPQINSLLQGLLSRLK